MKCNKHHKWMSLDCNQYHVKEINPLPRINPKRPRSKRWCKCWKDIKISMVRKTLSYIFINIRIHHLHGNNTTRESVASNYQKFLSGWPFFLVNQFWRKYIKTIWDLFKSLETFFVIWAEMTEIRSTQFFSFLRLGLAPRERGDILQD